MTQINPLSHKAFNIEGREGHVMFSCLKGVIIGLGANLNLNKVFNDFYILDFGIMEL